MVLKIDFNSDEAIYIQLRNQIIMGIATDMIREGDTLPSVRQMADYIGINMHTVNKAYSVLKQEGFVKLDRRKGPWANCAGTWMWCLPGVSARMLPGMRFTRWLMRFTINTPGGVWIRKKMRQMKIRTFLRPE